MDEDEELPGHWRNPRISASRVRLMDMADKGRRPAFDAKGNVRGFRSRPGAPQAQNDQITNPTGMVRPALGGKSDAGAWGEFFKGNSPAGVRLGKFAANSPAIAATAFPLGQPVSPAAGMAGQMRNIFQANQQQRLPGLASVTGPPEGGYLGNVIASAQSFFQRNGIAPPSPLTQAPTKADVADIWAKYRTPGTSASYG